MTLIEVLVATLIGLVVSGAAFSFLEFTSADVTRVTERVHADETARVALTNVMLQLHSACVASTVNPIEYGTNANELKFISEVSPLNANKEPISALARVSLHKIIYTAPTANTEGTLRERSWLSLKSATNAPTEFKFDEAEPPSEHLLLKGVSQTLNPETKKPIPVFQYYRYYQEGDPSPKYGQLYPVAFTPASIEEAELVDKVSINLTVAPEGHESSFAKGDRAVALEDSAILSLAPASESASASNEPCSQR